MEWQPKLWVEIQDEHNAIDGAVVRGGKVRGEWEPPARHCMSERGSRGRTETRKRLLPWGYEKMCTQCGIVGPQAKAVSPATAWRGWLGRAKRLRGGMGSAGRGGGLACTMLSALTSAPFATRRLITASCFPLSTMRLHTAGFLLMAA